MLKLKVKHMELVKNGKYYVAYKLLRLMQDRQVLLGLGDDDWEASMILDKLGFRGYISSKGNWARYYLNAK